MPLFIEDKKNINWSYFNITGLNFFSHLFPEHPEHRQVKGNSPYFPWTTISFQSNYYWPVGEGKTLKGTLRIDLLIALAMKLCFLNQSNIIFETQFYFSHITKVNKIWGKPGTFLMTLNNWVSFTFAHHLWVGGSTKGTRKASAGFLEVKDGLLQGLWAFLMLQLFNTAPQVVV